MVTKVFFKIQCFLIRKTILKRVHKKISFLLWYVALSKHGSDEIHIENVKNFYKYERKLSKATKHCLGISHDFCDKWSCTLDAYANHFNIHPIHPRIPKS